jgi:putative PEP-CTERM system TPR-repeat lipoprotein
MFKHLPLVLALALAPVLPVQAADRAELASRYYEDALVRYQRKDDAGAIIQLKNALQQDPRMLPALVLLGQAHLRKGEPAAAERVFLDAEKLGVDRSQIVIYYAQSYFDQGKYKLLLEKFGADGLAPAARLEVLLYRARAQLELSQLDAAMTSAKLAQEIRGGEARALAVQARIHLNAGRIEEAKTTVGQAIRISPSDSDALNMLASISHSTGDLITAARDYGRALNANPDNREARVARVGLLLDLNRNGEAWKDLEYLKTKFPRDARASYLRSVYFSRKGDEIRSRESLAEVANILDLISPEFLASQPQLQMLGGLAHFGLNQHERAKTFLGVYLKQHPREAGVRKLLASIYLAEREFNQAIAMLEPALRAYPNDAQVMSMLGSAYMGKGNHAKATQYLEQAAAAQDSPEIQGNLGMSLLGAGREEAGFNALLRAYKKDPVKSQAGSALAIQYIRRGQPKQAIDVLNEIIRRSPRNPTAQNLLGVARLANRDPAGARAAYEAALTIDRKFQQARLNLGKLDELEGKADSARKQFLDILKEEPNRIEPMLEMAALEERKGRLEEAIRWLEKAHAANSRDLGPLLALSNLHLRQNNPQRALEAAKDAQAAAPDSLVALMALASAQLAIGNAGAAKSTLRGMSQKAAFDAAWLTRIAALQLKAGDLDLAGYSLNKALLNRPGYAPALNLLIQLDMQKGDTASAENRVKEVLARNSANAEARMALGNIRMAQNRPAEALTEFRAAHARLNNSRSVAALFDALMRSKDHGGAARLMADWSKAHPNETFPRHALGEAYMAMQDWSKARKVYESLIQMDSRDARAHNNLANVLLRLRDPGALGHAERARELAPNVPQVNDTLGWVLVSLGQAEKGLRYLREASLRAPDDPQIKDHLNQALSIMKKR